MATLTLAYLRDEVSEHCFMLVTKLESEADRTRTVIRLMRLGMGRGRRRS